MGCGSNQENSALAWVFHGPQFLREISICSGAVANNVKLQLANMDHFKRTKIVLPAGTTCYCAGIMSTARHASIELKMADYSSKLYQQLEEETRELTRRGAILDLVLTDREGPVRNVMLQGSLGCSDHKMVEFEILRTSWQSGSYCKSWLEKLSKTQFGLSESSILYCSTGRTCELFHKGVQIHERMSVSHVSVQKGRVAAIEINRGQTKCQYFVNCAGQWAYELGHAGEEVSIPLHAFYLLTHPLNEPLASNLPTVIDPDGRIYIRNWQGDILSGDFEKNPKPLFTEGWNQLEIQNLQEDWDHFEPLLSALLCRMPDLEALQIMQLVNCPKSFTPDMRESPIMQGYFVLAGMNSAGISYGGGAGKYLAEWMVNGYLSENVWPLDLKHFGTLQSSCTFLHHHVMEVMSLYDLKVPLWDFQTGSQLHTSPLYNRLDAQGERWMEKHGFERVMYFVPPGKDLLDLGQSKTFYKPDWFDTLSACCKEAVCVVSMSSFNKFEISGSMLNEKDGYENDCSIAQLSKRSNPSERELLNLQILWKISLFLGLQMDIITKPSDG
ncbi:LOW QUALITY PROTEIN: pyruvate dehydrogenase phosphatase regulatory subunit, mitochondrial-like [Guaruba guarouba]